jgi:hypothetical protein
MALPRVTVTQRLPGDHIMGERLFKASISGWRPWAIGAALSVAGAAFLFFRWQRAAMDTYEEWWQRRDHVRANGHTPPAEGERTSNSQLFV